MKSTPNVASDDRDELNRLKERLLTMGGEAEQQVRLSVRSLVSRDIELVQEVLTGDGNINALHVEIDERCFNLLTQKGIEEVDLRFIVSGLKINGELERIGDFAVNISEAAYRYLQHPSVKPLIDIPRMADLAQGMLRDALNAYVQQDVELAQDVRIRDDRVDALKVQVFRELLSFMLEKPATTEASLELILISRHLERIADHATNVAEDVIFMVSGKDVRHHSQEGQNI